MDFELDLLKHVQAYRLTSRKALERAVPEAAKHFDELSGTLLKGYPLAQSEMSYYRLSAEAAELAGEPKLAGPLEGKELRQRIGTLSFCLLDAKPRPLLSCDGLAEHFPGVQWEPHYYLDADNGTHLLGRMLVDLGIDAGWLWRLVWKKSIPEAARTEGVAEILHEDLFVVGVATDNQKKIEKMDRNVEKLSEGRVRFYYSPELAALAA